MAGTIRAEDLTPEEWQHANVIAIEQLKTRGTALPWEKEFVRKDGTRVPVLIGTTMTDDETTMSVVLDLTERKQAEATIEALRRERAAETRFRDLLEAAPDAVIIVGKDGGISLVNGQTEKLFGYSRAELLGQPIEILIPERSRGMHPAHRTGYWAAASARSMGVGAVLYGRRKDGTEFPAEISLSPIKTEQGTLATAIVRDITERRAADEHRFRLAALVEASDDAIIGKTPDGIITSWNQGAQHLFGYSADQIVGKPITLLLPPGRENEETQILDGLAKGETKRLDTIRRRKDGRDIDVSVTVSPVRDSSGTLIGASKVVRDITDRKRAEKAIARAKDLAEAANRELEAFSYSVAHDLRAPLRGMNGFAQVLLNRYQGKLDAEGQDWLQEIVGNAKKMGELIDGLLSLARVTRSELRLEEVDLSAAVREAAGQLAASEPAWIRRSVTG
jgi:PAS domain S-box-containing protein